MNSRQTDKSILWIVAIPSTALLALIFVFLRPETSEKGSLGASRAHFVMAKNGAVLPLPRWKTGELAFNATASVSDPFNIELNCTFSGPGGATQIIPAFFDGDGKGGQNGGVWKVRFFLDKVGTWSYATSGSGTPGLDGQTGQVIVTEASITESGSLESSQDYPSWLRYRGTGEYAYLQAKFLDKGWNSTQSSNPARFDNTHIYLSQDIQDTVRKEMLVAQKAYGNRRMNIYLANFGDYGGKKVIPWLGSADKPDYSKFNLARMSEWDRNLKWVTDADIYLHFWFLADDSKSILDVPTALSEANFKRFIRYAVARWGGYCKVLWCLSLEYDENNRDKALWDRMGNYLKAVDPYQHPRSIHSTSTFQFSESDWPTYMLLQLGFGQGHTKINSTILSWRGQSTLPVFAEEFAFGTETKAERQELWAAFCAGSTPGNGSFLKHINAFVPTTGFYKMKAQNTIRIGGSEAYVLASLGEEYIVYLPNGGSVQLNLAEVKGNLPVQWLNPANGASSGQAVTSGGNAVSFSPPSASSNDWVLHIGSPEPLEKIPQVTLVADQSILEPGATVQFTGSAVPGDAALIEISWDFGDGTKVLVEKAFNAKSHQFNSPGTYTIKVTAKDANGKIGGADVNITVSGEDGPPRITFTSHSDSLTVGPGTSVSLTVQIRDRDFVNPIQIITTPIDADFTVQAKKINDSTYRATFEVELSPDRKNIILVNASDAGKNTGSRNVTLFHSKTASNLRQGSLPEPPERAERNPGRLGVLSDPAGGTLLQVPSNQSISRSVFFEIWDFKERLLARLPALEQERDQVLSYESLGISSGTYIFRVKVDEESYSQVVSLNSNTKPQVRIRFSDN